MDIYVTDLENNTRFQFPMLPETIKLTAGATFYSYQIIGIGDVRLPSGEQLTGFSWSGRLPGKKRQKNPYVRAWMDPKAVQNLWEMWKNKRKKLRLLITETPINYDVYLNSFNVDYSGGYGDFSYTISFTQAKDLKVYASGSGGTTTSTAATVQNRPQGQERPSKPAAKTYTVVRGDCLWSIAQKEMGDGSKYPRLYEANKSVIDPVNQKYGTPRYTIYAGQVFAIPN